MSVATSGREREEAKARLETLPTEVLERDLVHWAIAAQDTVRDYQDLAVRMGELKELHAEEETWITLHADELAARRRAARTSS